MRVRATDVRLVWRWLALDGKIRVRRPWALLVGPLLLLLALATPYRWLFFLAYGCLILTCAAYVWVRSTGPRLRLQRRLHQQWAQVGDTLEETWRLDNHSHLPVVWLEIDDVSTLPGYSARRVVAAGGHDYCAWTTSAVSVRRGVYTLGPLQARTADPFGVFSYEWCEGSARQIVIYPPLAHLSGVILPWGRRGGMTRADILQRHATPSASSVREYAPGDMLSHIHWTTIARTNRLMVKEFDQERAGALWIVLDAWSGAYQAFPGSGNAASSSSSILRQSLVSPETPATAERSAPGAAPWQSSVLPETPRFWNDPLELAIVVAASLAAKALNDGRLVGFLADDGRQRMVSPGRGPRQLWRILEELADLQATGALPVGDVLRRGRSSGVVDAGDTALAVITPALDGAWLAAIAGWQRRRPGSTMALLIVSSPSHASTLEARLAMLGASSCAFVVGRPLSLIHPPRPQTTLRVSPLGKAIPGGG